MVLFGFVRTHNAAIAVIFRYYIEKSIKMGIILPSKMVKTAWFLVTFYCRTQISTKNPFWHIIGKTLFIIH